MRLRKGLIQLGLFPISIMICGLGTAVPKDNPGPGMSSIVRVAIVANTPFFRNAKISRFAAVISATDAFLRIANTKPPVTVTPPCALAAPTFHPAATSVFMTASLRRLTSVTSLYQYTCTTQGPEGRIKSAMDFCCASLKTLSANLASNWRRASFSDSAILFASAAARLAFATSTWACTAPSFALAISTLNPSANTSRSCAFLLANLSAAGRESYSILDAFFWHTHDAIPRKAATTSAATPNLRYQPFHLSWRFRDVCSSFSRSWMSFFSDWTSWDELTLVTLVIGWLFGTGVGVSAVIRQAKTSKKRIRLQKMYHKNS